MCYDPETMKNERADTELRVFNSFACAAGLPKGLAEKRQPPEPDVLFHDPHGSPRAFELVELIDQDYRSRVGLLVNTKTALCAHYEGFPSEKRGLFDQKYGDALLYFRFRPSLTFNRRRSAFPAIFEKLLLLPDGFAGDALEDDPSLASLVDGVTISRGHFKGPIFDPECIGWIGNPSVPAISRKFEKRYETAHTIELLAYIDINPMFPDEVWLGDLTEFLDSTPKPLPFARIWVFDVGHKKVKLRYEGAEDSKYA